MGIDMYRCMLRSPWLNTDIDEVERTKPLHDIEEHDRLWNNHGDTSDAVGHVDSDSSAKTESRPESHLSRIRETISRTEDKVWTWANESKKMQKTDRDNERHKIIL